MFLFQIRGAYNGVCEIDLVGRVAAECFSAYQLSMNREIWTKIKAFSKGLSVIGPVVSVLDVGSTVVITFLNSESMGDFISEIPSILWEQHKLDLLNIFLAWICPFAVSAVKEYIGTRVLDNLPCWNIFSPLRKFFQPALKALPLPKDFFPSSSSIPELSGFEMNVANYYMNLR